MDSLILSQVAIFHLQKLASQVHRTTGIRHKLSDIRSVIELLNTSTRSTKADIKKHYDAFVLQLNQHQIDMLLTQGANLHTHLRQQA